MNQKFKLFSTIEEANKWMDENLDKVSITSLYTSQLSTQFIICVTYRDFVALPSSSAS